MAAAAFQKDSVQIQKRVDQQEKGNSTPSFERLLVNSKAFGNKRLRTYKFNTVNLLKSF